MKCPEDKSELVKKLYENTIVVDFCMTCEGMWLDPNELEKLQEISINDYSEELKRIPDYVGRSIDMELARQAPSLDCPVCSKSMERKEYGYCSQILIDSCIEGHGIWLQKNELHDLELFYEKSRIEVGHIRKGFLRGLLDHFRK